MSNILEVLFFWGLNLFASARFFNKNCFRTWDSKCNSSEVSNALCYVDLYAAVLHIGLGLLCYSLQQLIFMFFWFEKTFLQVSWSSGNAFVFEAGGLRFKTRVGKTELSVANGSPPLRNFFERSCVARAQWHGDGPCQLVVRFGVIQRVQQQTWFWFEKRSLEKCYTCIIKHLVVHCRPRKDRGNEDGRQSVQNTAEKYTNALSSGIFLI